MSQSAINTQSSVAVWWTSVATSVVAEEEARQCLTTAEQQRGRSFKNPLDQARWLRSRWFLRQVLGKELGIEPETIIFEVSAHGKPRITWPKRPLCFSFSHSSTWAAVAIYDDELGVDLEEMAPDPALLSSAGCILTTTEQRVMEAQPEKKRWPWFFAAWTAKEALMKATGQGLNLPPRDIHLGLAESLHPIRYLSHPSFWLHTEWLRDDLPLSICGQGTTPQIMVRSW